MEEERRQPRQPNTAEDQRQSDNNAITKELLHKLITGMEEEQPQPDRGIAKQEEEEEKDDDDDDYDDDDDDDENSVPLGDTIKESDGGAAVVCWEKRKAAKVEPPKPKPPCSFPSYDGGQGTRQSQQKVEGRLRFGGLPSPLFDRDPTQWTMIQSQQNDQGPRVIARPTSSPSGQYELEVEMSEEEAVCTFCNCILKVGKVMFKRKCNCPRDPPIPPILAHESCTNNNHQSNEPCSQCKEPIQNIRMTLHRAPAAGKKKGFASFVAKRN